MVEDKRWSKRWDILACGGKGVVSGDNNHREDVEASLYGMLEELKEVRVTG